MNKLQQQIVEILKSKSLAMEMIEWFQLGKPEYRAALPREQFEAAATEISNLAPLSLRSKVEELRDEAEKNRSMFARDHNPNYAYKSIGEKEAYNRVLSLIDEGEGEEEDLYDDEPRLNDNCPKCGREYDAIDHEYQICSKCKHENIPSPPKIK